ncbi:MULTISPECIES: GntR family transcriptional regulator [Streptomyces]|uniref:GntR family transcriptional regulator n=1 Tax=Streptomyces koelreuteriae TaxID=2838015 RepID=A0ABX8G102_9ACTN|nr:MULTISPECIES: GntR family transcriptional regulator [Streptomyces]QWB27193.1 GntR family transcriptional regulator [Streptomyces koelreuteriae]UUA10276.1 GntR family transcriptional regulator [Streptomyces koelreuteriae]UUA17883.1 GntR family transcriptional regulator [Streptomyces sp. CRCS-T-1]
MVEKAWVGRLPAVKSKADLVYDSLRAAIAEGQLRPGERVNMDELARDFGVSKIPVREAVKRLESEGLLVARVHAGVTVAEVDVTEMRGVFLAREAIDVLVARLAAESADDKLLTRLEETQQAMRAALDEAALDRLPELNTDFHQALAGATGYRIFGELTEQLLMTIRRYRIVAPTDPVNWRAVIEEHDTIIEALRTGDPAAAAEAARAHTVSQARHEVESD